MKHRPRPRTRTRPREQTPRNLTPIKSAYQNQIDGSSRMSTKDLILAIDNGTQSLKALIFDAAGQLLAKEAVTFDPYYSAQPAWAEQDPEVFWDALVNACQGIWRHSDVDKDRLVGVALTTQRGSVVNVDKDGRPLRPAMMWLDQRKTYGLPPVGGLWGLIFKVTRLTKTVAYLQQEADPQGIAPEDLDDKLVYAIPAGSKAVT